MKKFLSVVVVVKNGACLCFAAWVAIWGVLALAFWPGASLRAGQLLSMLAASLWIGFLQWLCFVREKGRCGLGGVYGPGLSFAGSDNALL